MSGLLAGWLGHQPRRTRRSGGCCALALSVAALAQGVPAATQPQPVPCAGTWPVFRGNVRNTGVASESLPERPAVRWRRDLGAGISATAAIADGRVFIGDEDGRLTALALADGRVLWQVPGAESVEAPVAVHDGVVFWADTGGTVRAGDAASGSLRWTTPTGGRVMGGPLPVGGLVLVGSYDGHLYALRPADGTAAWKYDAGERVHGTPGVEGEFVLVAACDAHLHVVRLADGTLVRRVALGSVSGSAAAVVGDRVVLGTYGQQVVAVDWRRGEVLWRFEDKERGHPFLSSAAVVGASVVIGGQDRCLRALNMDDGRERWRFATRGKIDSSPVVVLPGPGREPGATSWPVHSAAATQPGGPAGNREDRMPAGRVFFGSADGRVYGVDLRTGTEVWRFEVGGVVTASPAVAEGCLVLGTAEGVVYCWGEARN